MSPREILIEIGKLPFLERQRLIEVLAGKAPGSSLFNPSEPITEDEIELILQAKGIITLPTLSDYLDEDEDFEPIEVEGEPLSEQIIRERR